MFWFHLKLLIKKFQQILKTLKTVKRPWKLFFLRETLKHYGIVCYFSQSISLITVFRPISYFYLISNYSFEFIAKCNLCFWIFHCWVVVELQILVYHFEKDRIYFFLYFLFSKGFIRNVLITILTLDSLIKLFIRQTLIK